jgi:hypothetical protein
VGTLSQGFLFYSMSRIQAKGDAGFPEPSAMFPVFKILSIFTF